MTSEPDLRRHLAERNADLAAALLLPVAAFAQAPAPAVPPAASPVPATAPAVAPVPTLPEVQAAAQASNALLHQAVQAQVNATAEVILLRSQAAAETKNTAKADEVTISKMQARISSLEQEVSDLTNQRDARKEDLCADAAAPPAAAPAAAPAPAAAAAPDAAKAAAPPRQPLIH